MKHILFICTGNSCRSAIAEALTNHLGAGRFHAQSAGSKPVGFIHAQAIAVLARHAISTEELFSKSWDRFAGVHFDLVVTVCDSAAQETCPVFLGKHIQLHWPIADPAAVIGTQTEIHAAFDQTFSLIKHKIEREILSAEI